MIRLLRRVRELAEQQAEVAIALDHEAVAHLARERSDALFELNVVLRQGTPQFGPELGTELALLEAADRRVLAAARLVLGAMEPETRSAPTTYGRRGRVAE